MTKEELKQEAEAEADKVIIGSEMDRTSVIHLKHLLVTMYIQGATKVTKELEAQIEKMKCCENCGWYYLQQHWRENKEINESRMFHCGTCGNKRNWKLREIKEK